MITSSVLSLANIYLYLRHPRTIRRYIRRSGRLPDVAAPGSYSERMLWRKLVDRSPLFVTATDKLAAKEYIRRVCPDLELPATLWKGTDPAEIPDRLFETEVWVKASHGCDFNQRVRPGDPARAEVERRARAWLDTVYGTTRSEWAYSRVPPRIFVEESVGDAEGDLLEFNVRAGAGRPIRGSVIGHNKLPGQWSVYLDLDGHPVPGPDGDRGELPPGLEIRDPYRSAVEHATRLSRDFDYARFDFFWNGRTLYGGEITIYPGGGTAELHDPDFRDAVLEGWDLRDSHFLRTSRGGPAGIYARALRRRLTRRRVDEPSTSAA